MNEEKITDHIRSVRREFSEIPLLEHNVHYNPVEQFRLWMKEAVEAELLDPYAMCLSTVDESGHADSRVVYLRDITEDGFVFYTNYNSSKAKQIFNNEMVSLNFLWIELSRQVKIKGKAYKGDSVLSNDYFSSRPRASKIGAWASDQSSELINRKQLEDRQKEMETKFEGSEVTRPEHWGAIVIKPEYFEFWKGRKSRLHDRLVYTVKDNTWTIKRLSP